MATKNVSVSVTTRAKGRELAPTMKAGKYREYYGEADDKSFIVVVYSQKNNAPTQVTVTY